MKKALICLLSISLLYSIPANATTYKWKQIWEYGEAKWICYKDNSLAYGWNYINGEWYYFYSNGIMAHDTFVNGYYVNSNGAWTNDIPGVVQRCINVLPNSSWIYHIGDEYECGIFIVENENLRQMCELGWDVPNVYGTYLNIGDWGNEYFVAYDGTVFDCPHQGGDSVYQYDDSGTIVKEYKYLGQL